MPRLAKLKTEIQYVKLVDNIRLYQLKRSDAGDSCFESAQRLGIPYRTLMNKMKKPGTFTLRELQSIANTLNVSISSLLGDNTWI
ncbi:MAG: hypothetical protein ACI4T6_06195 [Candidatus Flemingiibacterium sp.]